MRHGNLGRRLGRNASHRHAMFNNMVTALLTHGRIETTEAKAKELRRFAEETITLGISVQGLIAKGDKASAAEKAKVVHAKRQARKTVMTKDAMSKLFTELAPQFASRKGGYTRIIKSRIRKGDAAPMAFVALVGVGE